MISRRGVGACLKSSIGILPVRLGTPVCNNSDRLEAYPTACSDRLIANGSVHVRLARRQFVVDVALRLDTLILKLRF